jgi:hypothetical protein
MAGLPVGEFDKPAASKYYAPRRKTHCTGSRFFKRHGLRQMPLRPESIGNLM